MRCRRHTEGSAPAATRRAPGGRRCSARARSHSTLADARLTDDGDELRRLLSERPLEELLHEIHLDIASNERRVVRAHVGPEPRARSSRLPDRDRLVLALYTDRLELEVFEDVP